MKIQDYILSAARKDAEELFKYAGKVPEDKLTWSPLDAGRTVIELCQEVASCPMWSVELLQKGKYEFSEENWTKEKEKMAELKTVDLCHQKFNENLGELEKQASMLTEEDLKKTMFLPFGGGRDYSYQEILEFIHWNCTYHLGQVGYIQTLYGDKEMY